MCDPITIYNTLLIANDVGFIVYAYKVNNDPCDEWNMSKLEEFYDDETEFSHLLDDAERESSNAVEDNFVDDMTNKFEKHGLQMFITQKQINWLHKIAKCKG